MGTFAQYHYGSLIAHMAGNLVYQRKGKLKCKLVLHLVLPLPQQEVQAILLQELYSCAKEYQCFFREIDLDAAATTVSIEFEYPPKMNFSKFIGRLKSGSSRQIRNRFPSLGYPKGRRNKLWQSGYEVEEPLQLSAANQSSQANLG